MFVCDKFSALVHFSHLFRQEPNASHQLLAAMLPYQVLCECAQLIAHIFQASIRHFLSFSPLHFPVSPLPTSASPNSSAQFPLLAERHTHPPKKKKRKKNQNESRLMLGQVCECSTSGPTLLERESLESGRSSFS